MISIKATNLDAAFAKIEAWLQQQEALVVQAAIGLAYKAFDIVLSNSPQYSGDFTANWKLGVNKIDTSFQPGVFPEMEYPVPEGKKPFQRGDIAAIMHAIGNSTGKLSGAKLGDTLWLSNSAQHDDLYAWKIEDNLIRFRPVNYGGEGPLGRAREHLLAHYSRIGKHNVGELL